MGSSQSLIKRRALGVANQCRRTPRLAQSGGRRRVLPVPSAELCISSAELCSQGALLRITPLGSGVLFSTLLRSVLRGKDLGDAHTMVTVRGVVQWG